MTTLGCFGMKSRHEHASSSGAAPLLSVRHLVTRFYGSKTRKAVNRECSHSTSGMMFEISLRRWLSFKHAIGNDG